MYCEPSEFLLPHLASLAMPLRMFVFGRSRSFERPRANSRPLQSLPDTPHVSSHPPQARHGLFGALIFRARTSAMIADMQKLLDGMLQVAPTIFKVAADVASEVPVPGLSIGLSALGEILKKLEVCHVRFLSFVASLPCNYQSMKTTIKGVDTLQERMKALVSRLNAFHSQSQNPYLFADMRARINRLTE